MRSPSPPARRCPLAARRLPAAWLLDRLGRWRAGVVAPAHAAGWQAPPNAPCWRRRRRGTAGLHLWYPGRGAVHPLPAVRVDAACRRCRALALRDTLGLPASQWWLAGACAPWALLTLARPNAACPPAPRWPGCSDAAQSSAIRSQLVDCWNKANIPGGSGSVTSRLEGAGCAAEQAHPRCAPACVSHPATPLLCPARHQAARRWSATACCTWWWWAADPRAWSLLESLRVRLLALGWGRGGGIGSQAALAVTLAALCSVVLLLLQRPL